MLASVSGSEGRPAAAVCSAASVRRIGSLLQKWIAMTDLASSSTASGLGSYRRTQAKSTNARDLRASTLELGTVDGADGTAAVQVLPDLPISADPCVVFTELARLLVPTICDEATVAVHLGGQLARRAPSDPNPATPPDAVHPDGNGWRLAVHTAAHHSGGDSEPAAAGYAAVLTCRWHSSAPTALQAMLVQFAARHAALLVHHTGQALSLLHLRRQSLFSQPTRRRNR